ncbi:carboxymuconolactone decarboxylase family protein [Microbulbifer echini]|uniref:Carboxymuconolactone decarboxylase family protein n=1 Tax=Microbulbifer echini TaxID=1529067 RepID=A0ABV4NS12_9GAMM|nr:carboxymuconolactone decarboxylase family protein [uncultured Microbulbifer sp.]
MRIPATPPGDLNEEQKPLYEDMATEMKGYFSGFIKKRKDGALLGPWAPALRYPKFGKPWWDYVKAISDNPSLPKSVREVAILATGAHFKAGYELYAHSAIGEQIHLASDKIATIAAGERPVDLTCAESTAYCVAVSLAAGGRLPEATWQMAVEAFGEGGAAELIFLVAGYHQISALLNGFDVGIPSDKD